MQWTTVSSLIHAAKCTSFTKIQSMNHAFTGWFMLLQAEPIRTTLSRCHVNDYLFDNYLLEQHYSSYEFVCYKENVRGRLTSVIVM